MFWFLKDHVVVWRVNDNDDNKDEQNTLWRDRMQQHVCVKHFDSIKFC